MKRIVITLVFIFGASASFGQSLKIDQNSIMDRDEKVGSFETVQDTLKIVKFKAMNIDYLIPDMVISLGVDPKQVKYISETSFLGEGSVRELEVYLPTPKQTPPSKHLIQVNYHLGRHTDMYTARFKYYKYYGVELVGATSVYRGDRATNFVYLGLSNEFNQFYRLGWRGHISLGPIIIAEAGVDELTVTGALNFSLQKSINDRLSFGPKFFVGGYNELAMGIVLGL